MKPGKVATVRLSPSDCMAVADLLRASGVPTAGLTFSRAVSTALKIALEAARRSGTVPSRDGFEFAELMNQFQAEAVVPEVWAAAPAPADSITPEEVLRARKLRRFAELTEKQQVDPLNFGEPEQQELAQLQTELF